MFLRFPDLPIELQRAIVLELRYVPDVRCYALITRRFYTWLKPSLYRRVRLRNDHEAKSFVECQLAKSSPPNVEELYLGGCVSAMAMDVLKLCPKIRTLTIHFSRRHFQENDFDSLLKPLGDLESLEMLSVGSASVEIAKVLYLPTWPIFHRLTHLHFATPTLSAIPLGTAKLNNLTHLSLYWHTSYSCTAGLLNFLARPSTKVLLLWYPESLDYNTLEDILECRNLSDRRVVLLREPQSGNGKSDKNFWCYATEIIDWRVRTNARPSAMSTEGGASVGDFFSGLWVDV